MRVTVLENELNWSFVQYARGLQSGIQMPGDYSKLVKGVEAKVVLNDGKSIDLNRQHRGDSGELEAPTLGQMCKLLKHLLEQESCSSNRRVQERREELFV